MEKLAGAYQPKTNYMKYINPTMISLVTSTGPLLSMVASTPGGSTSILGFSSPLIRISPSTLELSDQSREHQPRCGLPAVSLVDVSCNQMNAHVHIWS